MASIYYKDYTPEMRFAIPSKPTYGECIAYLKKFLNNFDTLPKENLEGLEQYWTYCVLQKNTVIVTPGVVCEHIYFICKGAVKHYTKTQEGINIVEFMSDCNFVAGLKSFVLQSPAQHGYICAKHTYGLKISYEKFKQMLRDRPAFEELFNRISEKSVMNIVDRLSSFQSLDAKGRYELMVQQHPDVFEKFTMQDISNYLGIKAETLSRLKREINKK